MKALIKDICLEQGADFSFLIQSNNPDGTPINLSTAVFLGEVKAKATDLIPLATFTFAVQTQTNQVLVSLVASQQAGLIVPFQKDANIIDGEFCYDIKRTLNGNNVRLMMGSVTFSPQVSQ